MVNDALLGNTAKVCDNSSDKVKNNPLLRTACLLS